MAHQSNYVPRPDAEFDVFQIDFTSILGPLVGPGGSSGIPQPVFDAVLALQSPWTTTWAVARNKKNRTVADVKAKDDARDAYEAAIRALVNEWVRFNANITNEDKVRMGIPIRDDERTPVAVPVTNPVLQIGTQDPARHSIRFRDEEPTDNRAKPHGVQRIDIHY